MGTQDRGDQMVRRICCTEEQFEMLEENKREKYYVKSVANLIHKCGNCGRTFKCATDYVTFLRRRSNLDELLSKANADDKTNAELGQMAIKFYKILDKKLDEDDWYEILGELMTEFGIDPNDIIEAFDELFSECEEYGMKDEPYGAEE